MPEAKATRHVSLPNEAVLQDLVHGFEGGRLRDRGRRRSELGIERIAGDSSAVKDRRARLESNAISSASAVTTAGGTSGPDKENSSGADALSARPRERASCSR